jgi:RHS repeat-associated protein
MRSYQYGGVSYANPNDLTQLSNGYSTTTYAYDNNGNLVQKTTDGTTTTYVYDYANRLTALGSGGATTTYGYDAFGSRVLQTGTSTTTIYPFKWYSVASSTGTGAKYSTTTDYVFNGDALVSTIDQRLASGVATGTAQTHFIHPDHLGSTNVVTDASGTASQTLDFFPYGATRISSGQNTESRQFIGQFTDQSALSYLNARYYDNARGQFLTEDPAFLAVGDPARLKQSTGQDQQTFLSDPQQMNSTSYGRDNPITNKDPKGNTYAQAIGLAPLLDIEALSGPVGWAAFGLTSVVAGAYVLSDLGQPNWETSQLVSGQGNNTDPEFNGKFPEGMWGRVIKATAVVGFTAVGLKESGFYEYLQALTPASSGAMSWPSPVMVNGLTQYFPSTVNDTQGNTFYRNSSGLLSATSQNGTGQGQGSGSGSSSYNAQIASIQAQINQIQAQVNAIAQSRANPSR